MKQKTPKQSSPRHAERLPDREAAAGVSAISNAPPTYGIGVVDSNVVPATSPQTIQTKLVINEPGDIYEKEADCVAAQVMRIADPLAAPDASAPITPMPLSRSRQQAKEGISQRQEASQGEALTALWAKRRSSDPAKLSPSLEAQIRHPTDGQPLSPSARDFFEPRFGREFSHVRLHTNPAANAATDQLQARAFTHGSDIFFSQRESINDRHLMAHELTHVIQQGSGKAANQLQTGSRERIDRSEKKEPSSGRTLESEHLLASLSESPVRIARDDLDAGVGDPAEEMEQRAQFECVKGLGGCSNTRPAGIPSAEELIEYNKTCRQESAYKGPDINPTDEECSAGRTLGSDPVSVELMDAVPGKNPSDQVKNWLQKYRSNIVGAERKFQIDRRAISGAIAWEALKNTRGWYGFGFARFRGPGKVHYKEGYVFEGDPVAEQVESAGYLPKQSKEGREKVLSTISGSLLYIGAIMRAFADIAATAGYDLNCDPPMLTTFFNAWDLGQVKTLFKTKKAPQKLSPNDQMGGWVAKNLAYLESAVGKPDGTLCKVSGESGKPTKAAAEQPSDEVRGTAIAAIGAAAATAGQAATAAVSNPANTPLTFNIAQSNLVPKRWAHRNKINAGAANTRTNITIGGPPNTTIDVTNVRQDTPQYGHAHTNEPTEAMTRRFKHGHLTNKGDGKGKIYSDFQIDSQGNQRTITYHAPHAAGRVLLTAQIRGRSDAAAKKQVYLTTQVTGLTAYMTEHPSEVLVGQTTNHGSNHWGTTSAINEMRRIVDDFRTAWVAAAPEKTERDPDDAPTIRINDFSLQYGGVYDFNDNWKNPHQTHRFGNDIDISRRVIQNGALTYLKPGNNAAGTLYQMLNNAVGVEPEDENHWHVDV